MVRSLSLAAFAASALFAYADFSGEGTIDVWNSSDWRQATPSSKVGCLDENGKFINPSSNADCGVFSRISDYPYTLSTKAGNCTFNDETQEKNTDSHYGGQDHAWNCLKPFKAEIYDELYTIDGFPYVFLCSGDIDCYFDAKKIPAKGQKSSIWPFRWGSQQMGITPGHVMLQLVWNKVSASPKREGAADIPTPRISLKNGPQIPLLGPKILA